MCVLYSSSLYGRLVSQKIPERSRTGGFLRNSSGVRAGTLSSSVQTQEWIQFLSFCTFTCFFILCFWLLSMPCRIRNPFEKFFTYCVQRVCGPMPRACRIFWCQRLKKRSAQLPVHCGKYPSKNQHFLIIHLRAFDSIPLPAWTLSDSIFHFHGIR